MIWTCSRLATFIVLFCLALISVESQSLAGMKEGMALLKAGKHDAAVIELEKAVADGEAGAAELLGEIFYFGVGESKNPERGCDFFEIAAKAGVASAQHNLAGCFHAGKGWKTDFAQSLVWYRKAMGNGYTASFCAAGNQYMRGNGATKDVALGMELCKKGAEAGNREAQADLGAAYLKGPPEVRNFGKAAKWLALAAKSDHAIAAQYLGLMHWNGDGVAKDRAAAVRWLKVAAIGGRGEAFLPIGKYYFALSLSEEVGKVNDGPATEALAWLFFAQRLDPNPERKAEAVNLESKLAQFSGHLQKALVRRRTEIYEALKRRLSGNG